MDELQDLILIVDDNKLNVQLLMEALKDRYRLGAALSGEQALKFVQKKKPDLILLDIVMKGMDGYEVCKVLKADPVTRDIPIIFLTGLSATTEKTKGFKLGAVDYITKPFELLEVQARLQTHLALKRARQKLLDQNQILDEKVKERTQEVREVQLEIIQRLAVAAEYRDDNTGNHIRRMSNYAFLLAKAYGLAENECLELKHASPMHDVGKIGIPDQILNKPGKLEPAEWELIKTHTTIGAKILSGSKYRLIQLAEEIALTHHEHWDGSGYPQGLKGEEIPLSGRLISICDVYDAVTSVRPYKKAWPEEMALAEIKNSSGSQFQPELVQLFLDIYPEILKIKKDFQD